MILIGISGKKRSGKNTVASYIKLLTNQTVEEFSFAQELKLELAKLLQVKLTDIESNKELYRPLLQALGEYKRKQFGDDIWINKCFRKILCSNAEVCMITDVRYLNEALAIVQGGGMVVRVNRNHSNDMHQSEIDLDFVEFKYTIDNNGTLDELMKKVKQFATTTGIKLK